MTDHHSADDAAIIGRIERYIKEPPENSRIFTVTPGVATHILRVYNTQNRPDKRSKIAEYVDDMSEGLWKLTGDTLKFSDRGLLRDGHNRLVACVEGGASFRTHVVFGIDDDCFWWMDRGKPRSAADNFAVEGVQNANRTAAILRWIWLFENGRVKARDTLRPAQIEEVYQDVNRRAGGTGAEALNKAVAYSERLYKLHRVPAGIGGAFHFLAHAVNPERARGFFDVWVNGTYGDRYAALAKAMGEIASIQAASSGRVHDVVRAAIYVKAWNLVAEGKKGRGATDLRWSTSEDFPVIRP